MNSITKIWVALIAVAVIAIGGYFYPVLSQLAGGVTTGTAFPHGIQVGLPSIVPTNFAKMKGGTGAIIGNVSQTASTTRSYDIAVTGMVSTDKVFVQAASSTAGAGLPFFINGASPSTTAGFLTISVTNLGNAAAVPNNIASTTNFWFFSTQ